MNPLVHLGQLGQSVWYDYITRDLIASGELARLISGDGLRGMTSNPTIFDKAVSGSRLYDADIRRLADSGKSSAEIFEALAVADVRAACDAFLPLYQRSGAGDGLVSLEVSPTLAHDADATVHEAERLWSAVDRPNAMIKIPGTQAGLAAITRAIAAGINVNVTLLFSVERYEAVIEAFFAGLERRLEQGLPVASIASVASFFVSRVDGKVDPMLDRVAGAGRSEERPPSPTRAWRIACSKGPCPSPAGPAWPRPASVPSGRCGRPPAPRTPATPTPTTSRLWWPLAR